MANNLALISDKKVFIRIVGNRSIPLEYQIMDMLRRSVISELSIKRSRQTGTKKRVDSGSGREHFIKRTVDMWLSWHD